MEWAFVLMCVLLLFVCFFVFQDRGSLCSSGYPGTSSVDQATLEFGDPSVSAPSMLGSNACSTTPSLGFVLTRSYCVIRARLKLYIQVAFQPVILLPQPPKCWN